MHKFVITTQDNGSIQFSFKIIHIAYFYTFCNDCRCLFDVDPYKVMPKTLGKRIAENTILEVSLSRVFTFCKEHLIKKSVLRWNFLIEQFYVEQM